MRKIWYIFFDLPFSYHYGRLIGEPVGRFVGNVLSRYFFKKLLSQRNEKLVGNIFSSTISIKDNIYKAAANKEIEKLNETEKAKLSKELFWGNEAGLNWHISRLNMYNSAQDYEKYYLKPREKFIELIKENCAHYSNIVEIGSGNGKFINYLYDTVFSKTANMPLVTGVELNGDIIDSATANLGERRINFLKMDFLTYVNSKLKPETLVYSTGTLEFLLQQELTETLKKIKNIENVMLVICEPVDPGYDKADVSTYRNTATFYSHNYTKLLTECGFIVLKEIKPTFKYGADNLLTLIAKNQ